LKIYKRKPSSTIGVTARLPFRGWGQTMEYLFVYGTLKKDYDLKLKNRIVKDLEYIGKAKVGARLYDLGKYPGAVKDKSSEVIGDVFLLSNTEKVLKFLDDYEGEEYERAKEKIILRSGKVINAWIYWYKDQPKEERRIFYKNYLNYLKRKHVDL
jgi:gamma-glutamylcyclotransferase (GGCT)/AIG2-like uncharacterized protein YtfP